MEEEGKKQETTADSGSSQEDNEGYIEIDPYAEEKKTEEKEEKIEGVKEEAKKKPLPVMAEEKKEKKEEKPFVRVVEERKRPSFNIMDIYDKSYKKLLLIPISLFILAIIIITLQIAATGDFINKDVSLKGGVTIAIPTETKVDINGLGQGLSLEFPDNDVDVRALRKGGRQSAIIITSDIKATEKGEINSFIGAIEKNLDRKLKEDEYSVEVIGSSLGASFFREVIIALVIAFILMGVVVLIYFRVLVPSLAVILAALSDILVTLAIVNVMGIKINTAGIAAFLMLIGYSVDTNILLSTKVLKRREGGTVFESILNAMKTGLMMTLTTVVAIIIALVFTQSQIIGQIMTILLIGLLVDVINTWIGNSAMLRLYLEKKLGKNE